METKIASLLNACPSDKSKLCELLEQYTSKSADASNTDSEDELEEELSVSTSDEDDNEQPDMTVSDCDVALQRASSASESMAAPEEEELQKAAQFR